MSTRHISFAIQGTYAPQCARSAETALSQLDGIIAAQVNYASERAGLVYDPARIGTSAMVRAVRAVGFEVPLERFTLEVNHLVYASSAHTVEKIVSRADSVAEVSANLRAGRVTISALPERASPEFFQVLLAWLGFPGIQPASHDPAAGFAIRLLFMTGATLMLITGAANPLAVWSRSPELPAPLWFVALAAFALFGASVPFYSRAFAVLMQGQMDASVLTALGAALAFFSGLVLMALSLNRPVSWTWWAWSLFVVAALLISGWFSIRGFTLWVLPYWHHVRKSKSLPALNASQPQLGVISNGTRH